MLANPLSLQKWGFLLNKQEFHDAIYLCYNYAIKLAAKVCACGDLDLLQARRFIKVLRKTFYLCGQPYFSTLSIIAVPVSVVVMRHNSITDLLAELSSKIYYVKMW